MIWTESLERESNVCKAAWETEGAVRSRCTWVHWKTIQQDQRILTFSITQPFHCPGQITSRLIQLAATKQRCTQKRGVTNIDLWEGPKQVVSDGTALMRNQLTLLCIQREAHIAAHTFAIRATSAATVSTGPPRVTSSRNPSFTSESKEDSKGWIVLQNRRGPSGSPCCDPSSVEIVYWPWNRIEGWP